MKRPTLLFRQIGLMLVGVLALNLGASTPARAADESGAVIDTRLSRPKSAVAYNADWTGAARAVKDSAVITATTSADSGRPSSLLGQAANSACNMAEGFDDIANLPGWTAQNNSSPLGVTNWFQGNADVFSAQAGAANAYIGANYNNGADAATISNWLLTPPVTLQDGATFVFWTRADGYQMYPDRLQVRLSTNGSSVDVGTTATSVGDFSTLLLDINPAYTSSDYPTAWTQYTVTLSGLPTPTTGRLALRYFVENGGPSGTHSNFIGLDTVQFTSPCVSAATTTTTLTSAPNPSTLVKP